MEADWNGIADWYADLVRGGSAMHQFSRDILLNALPDRMPSFDVLDVGCGEDIVSRTLATAGARVVGIDPTHTLIAHAEAAERAHPVGVAYRIDDGATLHTVADGSVDGVNRSPVGKSSTSRQLSCWHGLLHTAGGPSVSTATTSQFR